MNWFLVNFREAGTSRLMWNTFNSIAAEALVPGVGRLSAAIDVDVENRQWVNVWLHESVFLEQCLFPRPFPLRDVVNVNPKWVSSLTKVTRNLKVTINFHENG